MTSESSIAPASISFFVEVNLCSTVHMVEPTHSTLLRTSEWSQSGVSSPIGADEPLGILEESIINGSKPIEEGSGHPRSVGRYGLKASLPSFSYLKVLT